MAAPATRASLAIDGGQPVRTRPFAPWPQFSADEMEAAQRVLASGKVNYWTGAEGRSFESEFAASIGVKHAVALANGSVALELALRALGIRPGDEVIVPSRSFIASASCASVVGATPVFADCDRESGNMTAATISPCITGRTRAIIVVHLGGWPCEMPGILGLAERHDLKVIEDCAQAQGAALAGRALGSFGHAAVFSFCQDKIMTTGGEGGMLVTSDSRAWQLAWSYKDHGKSTEAIERGSGVAFRWLHESIGTNWRMTEMQSAMGRVMLPRIAERVAQRQRNAAMLDAAFQELPVLRVCVPAASSRRAYYRYYVYLRPERLAPGWGRDRILAAIEAEGVPAFSGSCSEVYLEKAFAACRPAQPLAIARELGETSLCFLVHHTLDHSDMHDTAAAVEKVLQHATR